MSRDVFTKAAIVVGAVLVGLVLLPVVEEIAVLGILLLVVGTVVALLAGGVLWQVARRHPLLDVLLGAWLLYRHERRVRRAIDARSRSVPSSRPTSWTPPDARTWRP